MTRWLAIAALFAALGLGAWLLRGGAPRPDAAAVPVPAAPAPSPPAAAAPEEGIVVPSGQTVTHVETIQTAPGAEGLTYRFRFLAPAIARDGGTVDAERVQADLLFLCETYALPRLPAPPLRPRQVIISMADRPVAFGQAAPEATQYFDAYRIEDGACIWEPF
ncbi:DUF6497 family protein [Albidovulum sp.]